jgi:adenylate cyclase
MLKREFGHTLSIGIGIHTGTAIMGEVGSRERSDYTLIGDSVNLAARLQELTKTYHTPIIISQATKDQLQQTYHLTKLDTVAVRGKDERITLYGVRGDST